MLILGSDLNANAISVLQIVCVTNFIKIIVKMGKVNID